MKHLEEMGGGRRYTPPMIEIGNIMVESAFAMSKDNVVYHQGYDIDEEFNW